MLEGGNPEGLRLVEFGATLGEPGCSRLAMEQAKLGLTEKAIESWRTAVTAGEPGAPAGLIKALLDNDQIHEAEHTRRYGLACLGDPAEEW